MSDPEAIFFLVSLLDGRVTFRGRYAGIASTADVVEFVEFASSDGARCGTPLFNQADR
ncbi:MAG: hypothetical protein ABIO49_08655 [Dokdonella sp.]